LATVLPTLIDGMCSFSLHGKKNIHKKNLSEDTSWTYCHGMVEQDEDTKAG